MNTDVVSWVWNVASPFLAPRLGGKDQPATYDEICFCAALL
ncbi:MAG TPA: hypothetical protein VKY92_15265 [Verrucomicrobiae bacterium]|nr:hypothetical protein [Verrucomicrobiae bacterium]